jgi:hypothetical protein
LANFLNSDKSMNESSLVSDYLNSFSISYAVASGRSSLALMFHSSIEIRLSYG